MRWCLATFFFLPSVLWAQTGTLVVLNKAGNEMALVDPVAMTVTARIPTGAGPHEVAISADGHTAFVANYGAQQPGRTLQVIDLKGRKDSRAVPLGGLLRPHGIAMQDGKVYFTAEGSRAVARLDPATGAVDWVMGTGQSVTHMLVISRDGRKLYTANIGEGTITMIDLVSPGGPQGIKHIPVGRGPEGLDLSPDGTELWVATREDGNLHVLDTASHTVTATIAVGRFPIRVKFTPDGKRVLVTNARGGDVAVIDAANRTVLKRIALGGTPVGILITPDGRWAFVASQSDETAGPGTDLAAASPSGYVNKIDLTTLETTGRVEPGAGPDGLGWTPLRP
jgi:YVTN family beta-propeller protein